MQEISKILSNSKTTETDTSSGRIISAYQKSGLSSDVFLTGVFSVLIPVSENLTGAIKRMKAESVLEEKDEKRDGYVRGIYYLVQGFLHHPDAAVKAAAVKIDDVIENYGLTIVSESYATETSLIESMLEDLGTTELQVSIEALSGLSQLIANLREAQTEFEQAKLEYDEERVKEGELESATKLKMDVISIINNKLVVYLRAMEQVDNEKYGTFAQTVATIIDDNNTAVKKRRKKP